MQDTVPKIKKCIVADPQKTGEGMSSHTTYKITTEYTTNFIGNDVTLFNVARRFSDFVWIRTQLRNIYPHLLVPVLPEKQQIGRFNTDFVELRQRALQRWMDRISEHSILSTCDLMKFFLTEPTETFGSRKEASGTTAGQKANAAAGVVKDAAVTGGTKVMQLFKGLTSSSSSSSSSSSATPASASMSAEDLSFAELEAYLVHRNELVSNVYNQAAAAVVQWREQAQLLLEYGAGLKGLANGEGGPLGGSLTATGLAVWTSSTSAYEQAVQESELWIEIIADHVRMGKGVEELIKERRNTSSYLSDCLATVEKLKANIIALSNAATSSAANDKVKAANDLTIAKEKVEEARKKYDMVATHFISEIERFRSTSEKEWKKLLLDWATIQWRNNSKLSLAWEKIVPDSEAAMAHEGAIPLAHTVTQ